MRWGIREEAADDHMMTELCMRELTTCQKLSTGPNFVVSTLYMHVQGQIKMKMCWKDDLYLFDNPCETFTVVCVFHSGKLAN